LRVIVSEFASNAVLHSGSSAYTLILSRTGDAVLVEVVDEGRWRSAVDRCARTGEGGRGWRLVETLARRAGVERTAAGTCAWAEVPA